MSKLAERINARTLAIVVALLLAAIATLALKDYVQGQTNDASETTVLIYRTNFNIAVGTEVDFAISQGAFEQVEVPSSAAPNQPISNLDDIRGRVVIQPMLAGNFLQGAHFGTTVAKTEAFEVPEGMVAMSLTIGVTEAVANFLDVGDRISIISHTTVEAVEGQAGSGGATTRILMQNVEILALGRRTTSAPSTDGAEVVARSDEQVILTVAVTPGDAERLTFASIETALSLVLLPGPVEDFQQAVTSGRNAANLFGR